MVVYFDINNRIYISFKKKKNSVPKVVSKILQFRKANKKLLDPIWNKHHIERIEIVLKETLDAKGTVFVVAYKCKFHIIKKVPFSIYLLSQYFSTYYLSFIYRPDSVLRSIWRNPRCSPKPPYRGHDPYVDEPSCKPVQQQGDTTKQA